MNCVDYFFEHSGSLTKNFLIGKEQIDFTTLSAHTEKLAKYLNERLGTGKNILLLSVNNLFFLTSYLAIMKSGNTCIPLDPKIEAENLDYIWQQTSPSLIIHTPDVPRRLNKTFEHSLSPEDMATIMESTTKYPSPHILDDEDSVAQIIFTSGSTGVPKGVMLTHKNLISNTQSIIEYLELTESDRMLVVMPFFYCYGLSLLHTHLRVGGSLVLNNSFIFLGKIIKDLKDHNCTGFAGVPSHFQILLRKSDTFKKTEFPALRYVTQAGGKLSTVFIDEFIDAFPQTRFFVMYGQTEATARLSYLPPGLYQSKKGSLGKGIPGVTLRVVNAQKQDVKPGETGEIIAKGNNIMKGYLNEPLETEKTIRDGWLYTGDLATVDEDGYIFHAGRIKEIMKISGKRVSPKEIEEVILTLPEVVDVTVSAESDMIQGEAIKAVVIVNQLNNTRLTPEAVKAHCAKQLALYKIPSIIELAERMQLSSSGKKVKGKL